jgi:hypothetical protein
VIGSVVRRLLGLTALTEAAVAGGDDQLADESPDWDGGRYLGARWSPCHPGRVGRAIKPWLVVVHATDMIPSSFDDLLRARKATAGKGNAEHFLIGRTREQGVVQEIPVDRNANHAGGPDGHGWLKVPGRAALVHPNAVAIGIEVHCAGALRLIGGQWRYAPRDPATGLPKPIGGAIPADMVEVDPAREGRGWHRPTTYQLDELRGLLTAIAACPVRVPPPAGWSIVPHGKPPSWAPDVVIDGVPVVGHVTLDPNRKGDPHPPIARWLREVAA